ncbi:pirin family protein [Marinobacterium zhoushanense]|uniref:Pirin family protein n=1 Tax=Marinobacterium zhoushanense TaxID=1679163 RepID=A0ABQ1KMJ1_9GAMM|nr:pirin family protein [Marinobacterium zhoushanense]GGC01676.1 pirin family protein [Marinobacterium zhoushanense]
MIKLRPAEERGQFRIDWLDSRHTFSFGHYYDPRHMGVSSLRVINDDRVVPGAGFETHPHRDMEIISYILDGSIEHRDTMGNRTRLRAGEVQVMSAGTGIMHSEFNPEPETHLHFLQIWIRPEQPGLQPSYAQKDFSDAKGVTLIVSPDGANGSLKLHQDARIYQLRLSGERIELPLQTTRLHYLQVARGALALNGRVLQEGDGVIIEKESLLDIAADNSVEALLFDLAA